MMDQYIGATELAPYFVGFLVMWAVMYNTLRYLFDRYFKPEDEFGHWLMSLFHSSSCLIIWYENSVAYVNGTGHSKANQYDMIFLVYSLTYMIFGGILTILHHTPLYLIHHILSIGCFLAGLFTQKYACQLAFIVLILETNSFILNSRSILEMMYNKFFGTTHIIFKLIRTADVFVFVTIRFAIVPYVLYQIWTTASEPVFRYTLLFNLGALTLWSLYSGARNVIYIITPASKEEPKKEEPKKEPKKDTKENKNKDKTTKRVKPDPDNVEE